MQKLVDDVQKQFFGRTAIDGVCVTCGSSKIQPEDFRDDISRKEFSISNMCQKCQDGIFGHGTMTRRSQQPNCGEGPVTKKL